MGPLEQLPSSIEELLEELGGVTMFSIGDFAITTYTFWTIVAFIVLLAIILVAKRNMTLVPGKFQNAIEYVVEFVRRDRCDSIIGHGSEKHLNLLLTIFFFIIVCNIIGIIPGCKPGTGTIGTTFAIALVAFIYFNWQGIKAQGFGHYVLSLAPKGLAKPVAVLVWCIELLSLFLRLVTLAIRLFANLYAGHIVLGTFALLTNLFVAPVIQAFSAGALATASASIVWIALLVAMWAMEILVACIQAYVFTLLTAVYISLATSEH